MPLSSHPLLGNSLGPPLLSNNQQRAIDTAGGGERACATHNKKIVKQKIKKSAGSCFRTSRGGGHLDRDKRKTQDTLPHLTGDNYLPQESARGPYRPPRVPFPRDFTREHSHMLSPSTRERRCSGRYNNTCYISFFGNRDNNKDEK